LKAFFILGFVTLTLVGFTQPTEKEQQVIVNEGFELYRLELASWNSSDLLASIWGINSLDSIHGYLSYRQGNTYNTIYYGGEKQFRIYANFVFDSVCSMESAIMDITPRNAGRKETELITMRHDALERVGRNENNFFEIIEKTSLNLIPVITAKERKVIILTGPQETGNVLFGNDFALEYSAENKFVSQTKLHQNLITVPMESEAGNVIATKHTHQEPTSEYITTTDICTLLLYGDYTNWKKHVVISDNFVSIWDVEKKTLDIISRKEFEKREKEKNK